MIKNEIKILDDISHVKLRKGMYIGATSTEEREQFLFGTYQKIKYVPGLVKIIEELINNCTDEAIRTNFKFANKISVSIDQETSTIVVEDNGRGLPQNMVNTPEGTEIPAAVAAWTRVKAGSNFDDSQGFAGAGQNGVGASLTNIFSKSFIGITCDGDNTMTIKCENNLSSIDWKVKSGGKQGTKVTVVPDFEHFECKAIDDIVLSIFKDQLQTLAVTFPEIQFKFNNERIQGNFKKYAKQFDENAIVMETDNIQFAIGSSADGFRHLSYINSIHTKVGGTHIDYVIEELVNELMPAIKRKYKVDVNKARIKECITLLLFVKGFPNARFDSQTKERLTSPWGEVKAHIDIDIKKLARMFMANDAVLQPIIEAMVARMMAAQKAAETKASKAASRAKVAKHIKANKYGKEDIETTLFLTEGDSAIGYLLSTRDRELHGGYPLRGKFMNTWNMAPSDILKNKESFDICAITGLVFNEPAVNLNYRNIAIMTDADVDGTGSIYPSLLAFFANWPELFEQGRIKFVKTPVWICQKGKEQKWFYTSDEYEAVKDELKGWNARYIKGLGSLEVDEYERVINEPHYDVVKLPENWKDHFEMLLGNDSAPRKVWMSA